MYGHQDGGHRTWDMLGPGAGAGVAGRGAVNHEHVCSWNLKLGDIQRWPEARAEHGLARRARWAEWRQQAALGEVTPAPGHLPPPTCRGPPAARPGRGDVGSRGGRGSPVLAGDGRVAGWLAMRGGWCGLAGGVAGW